MIASAPSTPDSAEASQSGPQPLTHSVDLAAQVAQVAEVVPGAQRHHRSISPTTMSMEPSVTMASARLPPTAIWRSALR